MNPSNGHWYAFSTQFPTGTPSPTWEAARDAAEAFEFMGMRGHLATITSESENSFISEFVNRNGSSAWIGASDP